MTTKAVALTTGPPIVAVPATYAGSEATSVWGLTEGRAKRAGADHTVLPRLVVYDAQLTLGLPADFSVASGFNALAHCIDALWAARANSVSATLAMEGARALRAGLPAVHTQGTDLTGRQESLYGAYLTASAFSAAGSGLDHRICHVLGGASDLPHAATLAVVLPHVTALNIGAVNGAGQRVSAAPGADDAVAGLQAMACADCCAPRGRAAGRAARPAAP